ncbi:MAG: division plane positioning ATPase MipZ [Variibacter sp.]
MLVESVVSARKSAHVIVVGNEKGGSGKSTTSMHIAIALMKGGQRVATIDLDGRQKSLTHYVDNRRAWAKRTGLPLEIPTHHHIDRADSGHAEENEVTEFADFNRAVCSVEHDHDFIIIDTPGSDNYLMRLAHSLADTLVTPLNDSFVDFDVLGSVDPETFAVTGTSHYAEMVREARRQRRSVDGGMTDWVVLRNRLTPIGSRNKQTMAESLNELAHQMAFRLADGFAERVVYREFYPRGLTALDDMTETTLGAKPSLSHLSARQEVRALIERLRLPLDERGQRRAAARAEWAGSSAVPLEVHDIIAD